MVQYIDKSALVAEIGKRIKERDTQMKMGCWVSYHYMYEDLLDFLDTLEVKDDSLDKFKTLQHITGDMKSTVENWGYAPNLYHFDGSWHVDWISCEEGDSIKGFTTDTPEEAIDEAYNWFHSTFCNN